MKILGNFRFRRASLGLVTASRTLPLFGLNFWRKYFRGRIYSEIYAENGENAKVFIGI